MPEGWAWTRLKDIAFITKLAGFEYSKYIEPNLCENGIPLFKGKNVQNSEIIYEFEGYIPEEVSDSLLRSQINKKCILTPYVGTIGNIGIHDKAGKFHLGSNVGKIELLYSELTSEEFVVHYLKSSEGYKQLTKHMKATAQESISMEALRDVLLPLPPKEEQDSIEQKLNNIFDIIRNVEINRNDLDFYIKTAKSKILDIAIHGKLVPQDPNDEPAEELLKRIATSDNRPYKKLNENDTPYSIPFNWSWSKFGDYIDVRDGTHYSPKYVDNGYPFVTSKNLVNGKIDFSNVKYISEKDHKEFSQRSFVDNGDILFAMIGSIGNPVLVKKDREFSIKNVALFKPYLKTDTYMKYTLYFLMWIQEELKKQAKGGMQPFVPLNFFRQEIFIPLPPLPEQYRIVSKIEVLFSYLDTISLNLE